MSAGSKNSHSEAPGELRDSPFPSYIVTWDQPQHILLSRGVYCLPKKNLAVLCASGM